MSAEFYVYGYFDPRNYRLFYVGKGQGKRKEAHLKESGDHNKNRVIASIKSAGLSPVIRVISSGLTEDEAFLVEAVLIWTLGPQLTNQTTGSASDRVRPPDSLHQLLPGFDTENAVFVMNVGEGPTRCWDDCRAYGFLAAGGGRNWSQQLDRLTIGDVVVPYLKGRGYVGVGRVLATAIPVSDFRVQGRPLSAEDLKQPGLLRHTSDAERCEYLIRVKWLQAVPSAQAKFRRRAGLFTTQLVVASLSRQPQTLRFIEEQFAVSTEALTREE